MSSSGVEMVWLISCRWKRSALAMPDTMKPTAIAEMTSTIIERNAVSRVTIPMSGESLGMRRRKRMSIMSQPTLMSMPAKAACGIQATTLPSPMRTASRTAANTMPVSAVRPPARAASREHGAEAAPGIPPIAPAAMFPNAQPEEFAVGI